MFPAYRTFCVFLKFKLQICSVHSIDSDDKERRKSKVLWRVARNIEFSSPMPLLSMHNGWAWIYISIERHSCYLKKRCLNSMMDNAWVMNRVTLFICCDDKQDKTHSKAKLNAVLENFIHQSHSSRHPNYMYINYRLSSVCVLYCTVCTVTLINNLFLHSNQLCLLFCSVLFYLDYFEIRSLVCI